MVKNRINTFILPVLRFFLASFLLAGCAEEELWEGKEGVPEGDGVGMVDIKLDVESMRDTEALESTIHTLRLVAFRSADGTLKMNKLFAFSGGYDPTKDNISEVIMTGSTELCIIANETAGMTENLEKSNLDIETVRQQMISLKDIVQDSLANRGIPMYAEYQNLGIKITHTKEHPFSIKASLERALAKITLTISNKTHTEITLESVTVKSMPAHSWLSSKDYTGATQDLAAMALSLTNTSTTEKSEYAPVVMYIPEYILTEIENRSYLEIIGKADVNGQKIDCSYSISLGNGLDKYYKEAAIKEAIDKKVITTADLSMLRNTHYQINVSDLKGYERDKMTFLIDITSWDSENIDVYEGGTWAVHPVSQRIPIRDAASFAAKFIYTKAPNQTKDVYTVYKWYRSQYKQTLDTPIPAEPSIELLRVDTLLLGAESVYTFTNSLPNASGEIFCEAAPLGGVNFRKSNKSTLMVIGDWIPGDEEKEAYPPMQDWVKDAPEVPVGASYLLRDTRDGNVYRTKRMADGNWWMIQELAYGKTSSLFEFWDLGKEETKIEVIGKDLWGVAYDAGSSFGGFLYNSYAAVQYKEIWPDNLNGTRNLTVQGLCPKGWHLPGNKNGNWSEEWVQLGKKIEGFSLEKLISYEYYSSFHFNTYTHKYFIPSKVGTFEDFLKVDNKKCAYHAGIIMLRGEYSSIGFNYHEDLSHSDDPDIRESNDGPNIDPQNEDAFPTNSGYPIRCIRD